MKIPQWKDYEVIAAGGGEKLERWGNVVLLRPDPQAIWEAPFELRTYPGLNAEYVKSASYMGSWRVYTKLPPEWTVSYNDLSFILKPLGFKHTGLFPEQAVNWDMMRGLIRNAGRPINVLNLFAYTGAASVACAKEGARVCHVDAAKSMVERAGDNAALNKVAGIRYIIEDCTKFVEREIRRGNRYDAVIMDPPSFGRGPANETWKIEDSLYGLVKLCAQVLSGSMLFFLINSYTTGLQSSVLYTMLNLALSSYRGNTEAYELCLKIGDGKTVLPCGCSALFSANN